MASGAPNGEDRFVEVGQGFLGVLLGSRVLRWMIVTPSFKIKTRCPSYVCPGSSCHTYSQDVNTETNVFII
jgi:hypothetical protein